MKFSFKKYLLQKINITASKAFTDEKICHVSISRISICLSLIALLIGIFILAVYLMIKTPLANYIPGFHGKNAQRQLVQALNKLDSLDYEVSKWETYNKSLLLVLEGENSTADAEVIDSVKKVDHKTSPRSLVDSLFRKRVLNDTIYLGHKARRRLFELLPPSSGMITSRFNPEQGQNGITMAPPPNGTILSVMDGTIISTMWEPANGWTTVIQHSGGLISIYRHLATVLLQSSQKVSAGEAIGFASSLDTGSAPVLELELWYNGYLVDPENYITF